MTPAPPETYTHGHHESVLRSHRWRTAENSAAYLLPHLRAGLDLLDVGCGPGTITIDLAARVAPGHVLGIDASEAVVEQARAAAASAGAALELRVADVYALDIDDESFDVVHAHQVLQHLSDPVAALREMRRACKAGGVVAVRDADYAAFTWYPSNPRLDRWLELYSAIHRANGGEPDAGRSLLAWAHRAGWRDDELTPGASTWCYANPTDRAWWGGLWADRMTSSAIARQAVRDGYATEAECGEIAAAWRQWAAEPDGWFAVLHGELLARC